MRYIVKVNQIPYDVEVELVGSQVAQPPVQQQQAVKPPIFQVINEQDGNTEVASPMPGLIWDISVNVGDKVSSGDVLIILEAMKMENEIVAPESGTVKQILVSKGATVESNDILIILG